MEHLLQEFLIKNFSINVDFVENKKGEITAGAYLLQTVQIRNSALQTKTGALLVRIIS